MFNRMVQLILRYSYFIKRFLLWDIQRQILDEFAGVPAEEARRIQREQIESDPILGPFVKKVIAARNQKPRSSP